MEKKFTPGPWEIAPEDKDYPGKINIVGGAYNIALVDGGFLYGQQEANANLIVSAPKLLEALEMVKGHLCDTYEMPMWLQEKIEKAIAKACGKE